VCPSLDTLGQSKRLGFPTKLPFVLRSDCCYQYEIWRMLRVFSRSWLMGIMGQMNQTFTVLYWTYVCWTLMGFFNCYILGTLHFISTKLEFLLWTCNFSPYIIKKFHKMVVLSKTSKENPFGSTRILNSEPHAWQAKALSLEPVMSTKEISESKILIPSYMLNSSVDGGDALSLSPLIFYSM
jgi:hypothetical protein